MSIHDRLCYSIASPDVKVMPIAWIGPTAPICRTLTRLGYRAVEVQVQNPASFNTRDLKSIISDSGLHLVGLSTGPVTTEGLTLTSANPDIRRRAIDRMKAIADLAVEYGATVAVGSVRGGSGVAGSRDAAVALFREALAELVDHVSGSGVRLLIEPQSSQVTDLLTTARAALEFISDYPPASVALELDSYHIAAEEPSHTLPYRDAWSVGRLAHVQLADTERAAPGDGDLPWSDILETLDDLSYPGWLSVECRQHPDSETAARRAADFLRSDSLKRPLEETEA